jgi:protein-S-isoprenylcysteine O-methyltransferase Ste14
MAWVYVALRVGTGLASTLIIASKRAGMLEERFSPGEGVKAWDRPLASIAMLLSLVTLVAAGLDMRFGWSPELALGVRLAALILFVLGDTLSKWAAVTNRFYSRIVRIQKDRGHTVVDQGPYRFVRHPGYAGGLLAGLATPIVLGSLWALVAAGALTLLLVVRTALEDNTLHDELPGYDQYAQRIRYRLVPGAW